MVFDRLQGPTAGWLSRPKVKKSTAGRKGLGNETYSWWTAIATTISVLCCTAVDRWLLDTFFHPGGCTEYGILRLWQYISKWKSPSIHTCGNEKKKIKIKNKINKKDASVMEKSLPRYFLFIYFFFFFHSRPVGVLRRNLLAARISFTKCS